METLTNSPTDVKNVFLNKFIDQLDTWEKIDCKKGKLTKETHQAPKLTTYCLLELCNYCIRELELQYILPGKIYTDSIEERFGKYRQIAGGQYHISIRQLFKTEIKLHIQSNIKCELPFKK